MVGIDIGNTNCKLALRDGGSMRLISARMPDNMVSAGEVTAPETMAQFLKELKQSEGVRDRDCAIVLGASQAFFRHVTLPPMNESELVLNLPYEFRDFISNDPEEYLYDYAVDELVRDDAGEVVRMELFAAAAPKALVESYAAMLRKAGFRLKLVTPAPMAYSRLIKAHVAAFPVDADKDVVLVDIGHADVTVSLFRGSTYEAARTIDFGCNELDNVIADLKGIDPYTASSYKYNNFEGVLDDPDSQAVYDRLAFEVNKVVNFYNFNNPDREIEQLVFMGGGAQIPQLTQTIAETVSVDTANVDVLLPPEARSQQNAPVCSLAIAAALEGEVI